MFVKKIFRKLKKGIILMSVFIKKGGNKNFWMNKSIKEVKKYWENKNDPSNYFLYRLFNRYDYLSILEVGTNCGNRLYELAKEKPDVEMVGLDINEEAVNYGNKQYKSERINNVELKFTEIKNFSHNLDNSYDIVFSWATLIYIHPREIEETLIKMYEIARKVIILLEIQDDTLTGRRNYKGVLMPPRNWKRNYIKVLKTIGVQEKKITIEDIPKAVWNPGGGDGKVIIVRKD